MDILPPAGIAQPAPTPAPTAAPVVGPATPAAPIEPERRVTANRDSGRGDLQAQQQMKTQQTQTRGRGRLLDLFV
jgi:hypothetical protein